MDDRLLTHMANELVLRLQLMGRFSPLFAAEIDVTQSSVRGIFECDLERPWSPTEEHKPCT